jgi:hypothetical protein
VSAPGAVPPRRSSRPSGCGRFVGDVIAKKWPE